jgi:hypothetical protein
MRIEQIDSAVYSEGMPDQDIARFRAQAEQCRQQAEQANSLLDKESWLRDVVWSVTPEASRRARSICRSSSRGSSF